MKKKWGLALLITLLFLASLCSAALSFAESGSASLGMANQWLGKTVEDVAKEIEELGYKAKEENKTGLFKDIAWEFTDDSAVPYSVIAWFNTEGRDVTRVVYKFNPDAALFSQICDSATMLFGDPKYQEYSEEKNGKSITIHNEALYWTGNGITYIISFAEKADITGTGIEKAQNGTGGFTVQVSQSEKQSDETSNKDAKGENSPKPADTPEPTATPKPVKIEISVDSVTIKETRYGTKEFYIRLKNNASESVDRIDMLVKGFNSYGEQITSYHIDTVSFYYDEVLKPGAVSPKNYYYTYYMLNEAARIEIAIEKYHFVSGRTVEIPEYQLKWTTYK